MRVVLDTSAIIYLNDFRSFEKMFTVDDVIKEVKDRTSAMKLSTLQLKIVESSEKSLDEIRTAAKSTGDLESLSETDVKILALAKELNCTIISDDRNIQNVAEKIGIPYISIFNKAITKLITWRKYCRSCNRHFERGRVCKVCGSRLSKVPKEIVDVTNL